MLDKISKLDSGTIRGLIVATIPLLVLLASLFGIDEAVFKVQLEEYGEKIVALITLFGIAYAAYARAFKPSPPITDVAMKKTETRLDKEEEVRNKEGGYANVAALAFLATVLMMLVAGCSVLGLQTKGGFNDRLAGGYSTVTAMYEVISARIDSKVRVAEMEPDETRRAELAKAIKADAQNLKDQVDEAKEGLDVVQTLRGVDFEVAEERLASTLKILEALQQYLEGR